MANTLALGSRLNGRYRIQSLVGSGGMGAVYKATDHNLGGRNVALKEMSEDGLSPHEIVEATNAFRQEANLLAGLQHPNLPGIHDYFMAGGHWYLVMDFIDGQTLEDYLRHYGTPGLPVAEVLRLADQICAVLQYLHSYVPPIIFRDLKPSNMMITASGHLYLIDFGIARLFKAGQSRDTIALGSPGYAAPEQYGKSQTTTQSDIYSFGATLHQLLTGVDPAAKPFTFPPLLPLNPQIPPDLEALVLWMVQMDENKRPPNVAQIRPALHRIASQPSMPQAAMLSQQALVAPSWSATPSPPYQSYQSSPALLGQAASVTPPAYGPMAAPPAYMPVPQYAPQPAKQSFSIKYKKLTIFSILGQLGLIASFVLVLLPGGFLEGLGAFCFLVGVPVIIGCMVYALVKAGKLHRWGWFVAVLLGTICGFFFVSGIAVIIFGLLGPTSAPTPRWGIRQTP